ncbi:hypothetical protein [Brevibacillus porteri]|uniref:Uncharacterized protein n=1 Tax=Brevibacillus porteri TaxID=2126350 RepID=A0ABX5FIU2_9BACL|nr:hypothetical protein [Brevibacillus porteri]MED1801788.1 hypothetical protein [Brevibacillus porteri]MED2134919.1 hypothetical protein [Brevibacillus porteri]MED2748426.1 hypothetical protein [Brevibacillus porteri]MED2818350.1 hypothetical protein [Brevibacillus porteri]MED2897691.1 hypothetical protein [Brevibacillus porteri]
MKKFHVISDFINKDTDELVKAGDVIEADDDRAEQLREKQVIGKEVQEQQEDDADLDGLKKLAGGYYELPNGDKVRGKDNAIEALKKLNANTTEADQKTDGEQ